MRLKLIRLSLLMMIVLGSTPVWAAQDIPWSYENPPGFNFKDPPFRVPAQIKQVLIDNVCGVALYEAAYEDVYQNPEAFKAWLLHILEQRKTSHQRLEELAGRTADKLKESGREALKTATREGIVESASCFQKEKETREKGLEAQHKAEVIEEELKWVTAWVPEAAAPAAAGPAK